MDLITDLNMADWIGIVGSILISIAYFGVSTGRVSGQSPKFQMLNLIGSIMIIYSLWFRPNAGAIIIEVLWISIATYALIKYWRGRR
jgi:hypothetical protein